MIGTEQSLYIPSWLYLPALATLASVGVVVLCARAAKAHRARKSLGIFRCSFTWNRSNHRRWRCRYAFEHAGRHRMVRCLVQERARRPVAVTTEVQPRRYDPSKVRWADPGSDDFEGIGLAEKELPSQCWDRPAVEQRLKVLQGGSGGDAA